MFTALIAYINGKYQCDYDGVFMASFIIDMSIIIVMLLCIFY